ncbi:MAG: DUF5689 domain-containing protein [Bacteroidota bacterium]
MKTLNLKGFLLSSLFLFTTVGCVDEYYDAPNLDEECVTLTATKPVSDITSTSTAAYQQHVGDDIIEAYVTSSDESGNFYKSVSFISLDGTVGFSMPIDAYNTYTYFEPGRKVYVKMKDLYYQTKDNATIIGSLYDNDTPANAADDAVGRIAGVDFKNIIKASCTKVNEDDIVKHLTVTQAKNNQYLNSLIEFDDVQFTDPSVGKKYYDPSVNDLGGATNHEIADKLGNKIILRVSEFASFSANTISGKSGKIRGVLTKFGSTFQFMVRNESDIKLTNPRIVPIFEETFANNFPLWTKYSVIGAQVWASAAFGNPAPCALMNGFSGSAQNNEDWLISPAINLSNTTSAVYAFETSTRFAGPALTTWVSTNYDGVSAPSTATWTQITTANFPVWISGSFTPFTSSGGIDISSYVGNSNFRIAFKYTSTTAGAASWEVDNVKVIAD